MGEASTTADSGIRVEPQREVVRFSLPEKRKLSLQDGRNTRKARKDAMPHERSSTPVLPFDFSAITLADRKIRFRRELPAARPISTVALTDHKVNR